MIRLVLLALLLGCGGPDDEPPSDAAPAPGAARAECEVLKQTLCSRYGMCQPTQPMARLDCLAAVATVLDCSQAVAVSASYQACLEDLRTTTCAVLVPPSREVQLPASCKYSILFRSDGTR